MGTSGRKKLKGEKRERNGGRRERVYIDIRLVGLGGLGGKGGKGLGLVGLGGRGRDDCQNL